MTEGESAPNTEINNQVEPAPKRRRLKKNAHASEGHRELFPSPTRAKLPKIKEDFTYKFKLTPKETKIVDFEVIMERKKKAKERKNKKEPSPPPTPPPAPEPTSMGTSSDTANIFKDNIVVEKRKRKKKATDEAGSRGGFARFLGNLERFYSNGYVDGYDFQDDFIDDSEFTEVNTQIEKIEEQMERKEPLFEGYYVHQGKIKLVDKKKIEPGNKRNKSTSRSPAPKRKKVATGSPVQ